MDAIKISSWLRSDLWRIAKLVPIWVTNYKTRIHKAHFSVSNHKVFNYVGKREWVKRLLEHIWSLSSVVAVTCSYLQNIKLRLF